MSGPADSRLAPRESEQFVIAIGQTWPDLAIEERVLAPNGVGVVDGRSLAPGDPKWPNAAGVLLGTAWKADASFLRSLKRARGVIRYGIGFDNVDIAAAADLGLVVGIVRDYCLEEVAEHALAAALALARGLPHWDRNVRAGVWRGKGGPRLRRISTLCFGVVGFGLIGRVVAEKAAGLFGRIAVHDPWITIGEGEQALGYAFHASLDGLLRTADILSVHVPLNDATSRLIDASAMARMKPGSIIVNLSRGGIVDESALIEAVGSGHIGGAALDTFEHEPLAAGSPLAAAPNILLSPHVAWLSEESATALRQRAAEEMLLVLAGELPSSPVAVPGKRQPRA